MTAETLKPFITPTSAVNSFPVKQTSVTHSKRNPRQLIAIILGVIALVLVAGILTLTIWQTIRVRQLDNDMACLRRELDSLRQRLGINYLEDLAEFQKEYTNLLIQDPNKLDDIEDDEEEDDDDNDGEEDEDDDADNWGDSENEDDDDEDAGNAGLAYDEYLDLIKQEKVVSRTTDKGEVDEVESSAATSSSSSSAATNEDNVFEDFTSYNDSKKKRERKSRSIAESNVMQSNDLAQNRNNQSRIDQIKDSAVSSDNANLSHPQKPRMRGSRQGRQRLLVRKGESPVSAKSADFNAASGTPPTPTPAAHFHLNRKVSHHQAPIQLNSYQGDMYIGHATATSDNQWQQHFSVHNGVLTVHQPGLYYVYAQICYNNTHDQNGFIIFHGHNAFLQCLNTVPTNMPQKIHTCHTSGLIQLQEQESIHLRDIHRDRNVMLRDANNRSYFGIIKV